MKTLARDHRYVPYPDHDFLAYGMNFNDNEIPLNGEPHAFWLIVLSPLL